MDTPPDAESFVRELKGCLSSSTARTNIILSNIESELLLLAGLRATIAERVERLEKARHALLGVKPQRYAPPQPPKYWDPRDWQKNVVRVSVDAEPQDAAEAAPAPDPERPQSMKHDLRQQRLAKEARKAHYEEAKRQRLAKIREAAKRRVAEDVEPLPEQVLDSLSIKPWHEFHPEGQIRDAVLEASEDEVV